MRGEDLIEMGLSIGELCARKNLAYGNSAMNVARVLEVMLPDGIPADRYESVLLCVRVLDKVSRILAGHGEAEGESSWQDIAGYGILGATASAGIKDQHNTRANDVLSADEAIATEGGLPSIYRSAGRSC